MAEKKTEKIEETKVNENVETTPAENTANEPPAEVTEEKVKWYNHSYADTARAIKRGFKKVLPWIGGAVAGAAAVAVALAKNGATDDFEYGYDSEGNEPFEAEFSDDCEISDD